MMQGNVGMVYELGAHLVCALDLKLEGFLIMPPT